MTSVEDMSKTEHTPSDDEAISSDGRTMRRTRNRASVIDALLEMIREGDLRPAASEIADRAGVSHRSIFRYFDDLDDLVRTTIAQAFGEASELSVIPHIGEGTTAERIDHLVDSRLALYAFVDRPMQLARTRSYSIPTIDDEIAGVAQMFRDQIHLHLASELSHLDQEQCSAVVDAVLVLTSYDSYYIHVRLLGDDVDKIRSTWKLSLAALLHT